MHYGTKRRIWGRRFVGTSILVAVIQMIDILVNVQAAWALMKPIVAVLWQYVWLALLLAGLYMIASTYPWWTGIPLIGHDRHEKKRERLRRLYLDTDTAVSALLGVFSTPHMTRPARHQQAPFYHPVCNSVRQSLLDVRTRLNQAINKDSFDVKQVEALYADLFKNYHRGSIWFLMIAAEIAGSGGKSILNDVQAETFRREDAKFRHAYETLANRRGYEGLRAFSESAPWFYHRIEIDPWRVDLVTP